MPRESKRARKATVRFGFEEDEESPKRVTKRARTQTKDNKRKEKSPTRVAKRARSEGEAGKKKTRLRRADKAKQNINTLTAPAITSTLTKEEEPAEKEPLRDIEPVEGGVIESIDIGSTFDLSTNFDRKQPVFEKVSDTVKVQHKPDGRPQVDAILSPSQKFLNDGLSSLYNASEEFIKPGGIEATYKPAQSKNDVDELTIAGGHHRGIWGLWYKQKIRYQVDNGRAPMKAFKNMQYQGSKGRNNEVTKIFNDTVKEANAVTPGTLEETDANRRLNLIEGSLPDRVKKEIKL